MDRPTGFYWVKLDTGWTPAEYDGGDRWHVEGNPIDRKHLLEIGQRIYAPDDEDALTIARVEILPRPEIGRVFLSNGVELAGIERLNFGDIGINSAPTVTLTALIANPKKEDDDVSTDE